MEELKESIKKLISEELERANQKFPAFHSAHEGYAVIKEEYEETQNEVRECGCNIGELWNEIKDNNTLMAIESAYFIKDRALSIAAEAIQVSAMAQKFINSLKVE